MAYTNKTKSIQLNRLYNTKALQLFVCCSFYDFVTVFSEQSRLPWTMLNNGVDGFLEVLFTLNKLCCKITAITKSRILNFSHYGGFKGQPQITNKRQKNNHRQIGGEIERERERERCNKVKWLVTTSSLCWLTQHCSSAQLGKTLVLLHLLEKPVQKILFHTPSKEK